jgi:hypothetical protein
MSNRTEQTTTRLLLQKEKPYAEIEENSRIALAILQDDGWSLERIGSEISVTVIRTPVPRPGIEQQLADCELRYTALRGEVDRLHREAEGERCDAALRRAELQSQIVRIRRRHWLGAAVGCLICSALAHFHISVPMTPLGAACILAWRFYGYRRAKGAK